MIDVIKGEGAASGRPLPTFIGLGSDTFQTILETSEEAVERAKAWKDVTCSTDLPK